jgi:hypothetical protein
LGWRFGFGLLPGGGAALTPGTKSNKMKLDPERVADARLHGVARSERRGRGISNIQQGVSNDEGRLGSVDPFDRVDPVDIPCSIFMIQHSFSV